MGCSGLSLLIRSIFSLAKPQIQNVRSIRCLPRRRLKHGTCKSIFQQEARRPGGLPAYLALLGRPAERGSFLVSALHGFAAAGRLRRLKNPVC